MGEASKEVAVVFMIGRGRVITCSPIWYGEYACSQKQVTPVSNLCATTNQVTDVCVECVELLAKLKVNYDQEYWEDVREEDAAG